MRRGESISKLLNYGRGWEIALEMRCGLCCFAADVEESMTGGISY